MKRVVRRLRSTRAFTLVEMMIVVSMVSILALIAVPLYTKDVAAAIMTEGVAGAGVIRGDMRCYYSEHGSYAGAVYSATYNNLTMGISDLCGKYFTSSNYTLTGVTASEYTITAGPPSLANRADVSSLKYQINQDGSETSATGFYTSGF